MPRAKAKQEIKPDAELKRRAQKILRRLKKAYPNATTELKWSNALELLVATILSAQCTDERVNKVTAELFKKYRTAEDYANADLETLQEEIRPTGFYRNKAKTLIAVGKTLVEKYGGKVPETMEEMLTLPGVQRKTANVVLSHAIRPDDPQGIVVDRHVARVVHRLGLVPEDLKKPDQIEEFLMKLFSKRNWVFIGDALVLHGRYVCTARKPRCDDCILEDVCEKRGVE